MVHSSKLTAQTLKLAMRDSARNRSMRLPLPSPYRSLTLVAALLVLALLLLVLDQGGLLGPFRAQLQTLITPLVQPLRRLGDGLGGVGQSIADTQQLRDRVAALEQENSQLKAENIQIQELKLRLDQLETQLRIEKQHAWKLLGADVSARSPDGGRRLVMLNAGAEQGVRPGMAVLGQEGSSPPALIGVVEQAGPRSASVLLITDYSSAVSAKLYHQNTVATGAYSSQCMEGRLPIARGIALSADDIARAWVIERLMCDFDFSPEEAVRKFGRAAHPIIAQATQLSADSRSGLQKTADGRFAVHPGQRLFVRTIAAEFDAYLKGGTAKHSIAV